MTSDTRKRSSKTETLGGVFSQMMADARAGIRRCDDYADRKTQTLCGRVATEVRWDPRMQYDHPFCATHAALWDRTPENDR